MTVGELRSQLELYDGDVQVAIKESDGSTRAVRSVTSALREGWGGQPATTVVVLGSSIAKQGARS